ncbi:GH12663 [Drosophila grimshawi]|uniref:GH12663 n=1 Tax=Drosophila grimshawi TaxID=7222 RepID=B4JKH6_DROGR|nr:GH12663 [Drosophila grimshawi]
MSDLSVVGQPMRVGDKFVPCLSVRRIYNMKCFRPERYQHEVANHYRDFKLQQSSLHLNRRYPQGHSRHHRHRRHPRSRHRPLAPMHPSASSVQHRCELPTHVHYFPSSGFVGFATTTTSTSTTPSASAPVTTDVSDSDLISSISQGAAIATTTGTSTRARYNDDDAHNNNNNINTNTNKSSERRSGSSRNYGHRVLNINTTKVENLANCRIDLYAYLQLASGYYERGLHANIKYLQSIGQRNAIKQQQHHQQQKQQQQQKQKQRRYSLEAWPQQQAVDDPSQQQQQRQLSTFLNDLQRCQTGPENINGNARTDAIRVHITPAKDSMCDYANRQCSDNNINNKINHINSSSSSSSNSIFTEVPDQQQQQQQQRKLYEIIDNLSQLRLCDSRLPLITLTDYTQQVALYGANFDIAGNCEMQIPNEARPPT